MGQLRLSAVLGWICITVSILAMVAGGLGMVFSFLFLASSNVGDLTAGAAAFIAASVLIGSGLIALTIISTHAARVYGEPQRAGGAPQYSQS